MVTCGPVTRERRHEEGGKQENCKTGKLKHRQTRPHSPPATAAAQSIRDTLQDAAAQAAEEDEEPQQQPPPGSGSGGGGGGGEEPAVTHAAAAQAVAAALAAIGGPTMASTVLINNAKERDERAASLQLARSGSGGTAGSGSGGSGVPGGYSSAVVVTSSDDRNRGGGGGGGGGGGSGEDGYFDDPLRLPFGGVAPMEAEDDSCLKRLQNIVKMGCPVDVERDLKTLLYCIASGKPRCVSFLMSQGVRFEGTDAPMRVAALAARHAIETCQNVDSRRSKEELQWRVQAGMLLLGRGSPLIVAPSAAAAVECASDRNADPVFRYDPMRGRFAAEDLCASVPAILGVKDYAADHRAAAGPGGEARARRFCTWAVAAKQKAAQSVWLTWRTKAESMGLRTAVAFVDAADAASSPKASPTKAKK